MGMSSPPFSCGWDLLAVLWHVGGQAGDVAAWQQHVPVELLERELAEMVQAGLFQQRQADWPRESPGHRFGVVVVVDEERLAEPAFDEAVGVAVEVRAQRLPGEEAADVAGEGLALEVGDGTCLGGPDVGGVADDEYVRAGLGLERLLSQGTKPSGSPSPGDALT